MSTINYNDWFPVGVQLQEAYPNLYVNTEGYQSANPMEALTVPEGIETFFGSKALTFLIVGIPYGWENVGADAWEDAWPPDGYAELLARHQAVFEKFTHYQCVVLVDFWIVNLVMTENAASKFEEMMEATDGHMQEMCLALADYGFSYGGRITEPPRIELLQPFVEEFRVSAEGEA